LKTSDLNNQDGFITVALVLLLSLLIVIGTYRVELVKMFAIRTQLHTACDAASLAGASTAAVTPADISYVTEIDAEGNTVKREIVGRWDVDLDKNLADPEGVFAAQLNYPNFDDTNWSSSVNGDEYLFRLHGIPFHSPLTAIWNSKLYLNSECTSKAVHR
jgi:Flp pilus assembly protein TadG